MTRRVPPSRSLLLATVFVVVAAGCSGAKGQTAPPAVSTTTTAVTTSPLTLVPTLPTTTSSALPTTTTTGAPLAVTGLSANRQVVPPAQWSPELTRAAEAAQAVTREYMKRAWADPLQTQPLNLDSAAAWTELLHPGVDRSQFAGPGQMSWVRLFDWLPNRKGTSPPTNAGFELTDARILVWNGAEEPPANRILTITAVGSVGTTLRPPGPSIEVNADGSLARILVPWAIEITTVIAEPSGDAGNRRDMLAGIADLRPKTAGWATDGRLGLVSAWFPEKFDSTVTDPSLTFGVIVRQHVASLALVSVPGEGQYTSGDDLGEQGQRA